MLTGDFPSSSQSRVRHAQFTNYIALPCGEEPMDTRGIFQSSFGKSTPAHGDITKKSSSALASTLSTCQVPVLGHHVCDINTVSKPAGGASLLVGCVLGKSSSKPKHQIRGSIKRNPSERKKELLVTSSHDRGPTLNGKGRPGTMALPRSISINALRISNLNSPQPSQKFLGTTMTFLFDKVASITDCRSTGHFVLPKRKVEEHFPPINKPGGIWMTLVDAAGKEWSFEFCFWHSKESRIYYFKKFYPYVQSTDLCGGDTVFFSRLEPQGTLFMGFRKQKPSPPKDQSKRREQSNGGPICLANDWSPSPDELANPQEKPVTMSIDEGNCKYASERGTSQCKRKRKKEFPPVSLSKRTEVVDHLAADKALVEKKSTTRLSVSPEAPQHVDKISGVLGSKGKRLRVNVDEYSEWKDTQDLLRPAPGALPSVVTIEGHDFEEYEKPPILIKRSCCSLEARGESQWVKCDDCGSWRRLPADAFVPEKWNCSDNDRDLTRAYCNAPQEPIHHDSDQLQRFGLDVEGRIKDESESREEVYEYDWATPEQHHSARADACDYKQPTLWSAAMTLIDGSLRRGTDSYSQLEKCSTYTSDSDSLDQSPSSALQSPRLEQFCELIEESSPMSTNSHATEAGRDLEVSTDCDEPIDSAGNGKRYEMTTTECYDFLGPPGK
uniref:CW-type domain-containing protein n=2 Tax=Physcomitrium patens TaxID=3218 RepID=A0A7I4AC31_PHYPA